MSANRRKFYITAQYPYIATVVSNGAKTERQETANISEFVYASDADEAAEIAETIFSRYEARGHIVTNRRVVETGQRAGNVAMHAPVSELTRAAANSGMPRATCQCKKCGVIGRVGEYPFSTLPQSSRLCDDCGA